MIHPSSFTLIYDHVQIPTPVLQPQFLVLAKLQLSAALLRVGVFSFGGGVFVFLFSVFCCCFFGGVGVFFVVLGVLGGVWGAFGGLGGKVGVFLLFFGGFGGAWGVLGGYFGGLGGSSGFFGGSFGVFGGSFGVVLGESFGFSWGVGGFWEVFWGFLGELGVFGGGVWGVFWGFFVFKLFHGEGAARNPGGAILLQNHSISPLCGLRTNPALLGPRVPSVSTEIPPKTTPPSLGNPIWASHPIPFPPALRFLRVSSIRRYREG